MGWVRDVSGCSASGDGRAFTAQEKYLLSGGPDPASITLNPEGFKGGDDGATPLAKVNTPHPSNPAALLDAYDVSTDGAIATIIGRYSTDRRFRLPTLPSVTGFRWRASTSPYVFALPYAVKTTQRFFNPLADGAQGPPTFTDRHPYVYLTMSILVRAQRIAMDLRITDSKINEALDLTYNLQNKAMPINGRVWIFEGGEVNAGADSSDYRVSLSFSREPDIVLPYAQLPAETYWPQLAGTFPGFTAAQSGKPAYHKTIIIPPTSGDPGDNPTFKAIPTTDFVANGFQQLSALVP